MADSLVDAAVPADFCAAAAEPAAAGIRTPWFQPSRRAASWAKDQTLFDLPCGSNLHAAAVFLNMLV